MCASIRTRSSFASPTCRARRRPPNSTCRRSRNVCRWRCSAVPASPRSASCPTWSRSRRTASNGSSFRSAANPSRCSPAPARSVFERDVLPGHLARTRWYPERSAKAIHPTLTGAIPFCDIGDNRPYLTFFETAQHGVKTRYVLPMQIEWVRFDRERYNPKAFAAVRQGAREGTLLDVATDHIFIALLLRNLREKLTVEEEVQGLSLEFRPTSKFHDKPIRQPERIRAVETEQSNSTALVDEDYVVKIYRKLEAGINPEIEMGRCLTHVAGFANAPPLVGSVELREGEQRSAIGVVHAFLTKQGDAW